MLLLSRLEISITYCELVDGNVVNAVNCTTMENVWHRRYGHLGENNLHKLAKDGLVHGFNYDTLKKLSFVNCA